MTSPTRVRPLLVLLFVGALVMSCAELLVVGLIDRIADDLAMPVTRVGILVTAEALGSSVCGPLLAVVTTRIDRRVLILATLTVFVAGNLIPVLGFGFWPFAVVRFVTGAALGLYVAAAITTATSIVPPERAGRAMAAVISGSAAAGAFGLPLGTLLGHAVGWRGAFLAVALVGAVVLVAAFASTPRTPSRPESSGVGGARFAFAPRVLAVLAFCALVFAGLQSALTYLVPIVSRTGDVSPTAVTLFLLAYGVATTVGSALGGRLADANSRRTLVLGAAGLCASLVVLSIFSATPVVAAIAVLGMGLCGMGMAPSMQHRVVTLAGPGASVAAALPSSAANAGIAVGPITGGLALAAAGAPAAPLVGAGIATLAIIVAIATYRLRPPVVRTDTVPDPPRSSVGAEEV